MVLVSSMPTGQSLVNLRRTIVVHTKLVGHMARVEAARNAAHGTQIFTMGQVASRLAGGFLRPIDPEALQDAVKDALNSTNLWSAPLGVDRWRT